MMMLKKLITFLLLLAAIQPAHTQVSPSVTVSVDKNTILLGEPFLLIVEVRIPEKTGTRFGLPDTITHFELLEEPAIDSFRENGVATFKGRYKLTSFDSGRWVIPSFPVSASVKSDTIGIDVVFSAFNPEQPYHDIKDIIEVTPQGKKYRWWYAAAGVLVLAAAAVYFFRKEKTIPVVKPVLHMDPYAEALHQLEQLRENRPDSKAYHSALTNIFRLYVFRKKGILSLQKTTDDLILPLKNLGLPKEDFERLTRSLRLSDIVKFAKFNPTAAENEKSFNEILNAIKTIERSGS
jgi:hypothetical protein